MPGRAAEHLDSLSVRKETPKQKDTWVLLLEELEQEAD